MRTNNTWYRHSDKRKGKPGAYRFRRYNTPLCKSCESRHLCTKSKNGRDIDRSEYACITEANARRVNDNPGYYKLRQQVTEHPFGTFKYVEPDIFEKYRNGWWQLGTIEQYRTIENKKQRDEFEGFSFLYLDINNHIVSTSFISGFNYLILCGTISPDSDYHKDNFGKKIMYFPDVRLLAEKKCTLINAKKYYIQKIEYNSLKFYVSQQKIFNKYLQLENLLSPTFFDIIGEHILYPSIFVKPENYEPENEVRIVFEMERDQHEPFSFFNEELSKYVEFL